MRAFLSTSPHAHVIGLSDLCQTSIDENFPAAHETLSEEVMARSSLESEAYAALHMAGRAPILVSTLELRSI